MAHTTTLELSPSNVNSIVSGTVDVVATLPEDALAMGLVVTGTDKELKFIEHDGLWLGDGDDMRGPSGAVPYAFPRFDLDGNGSLESPLPSALNHESVAVHFPNDGLGTDALVAGTYRFPVGAVDGDGFLDVDTLTPTLYYKVAAEARPTLKLNVFVLAGVSGGITDQPSAAADAEIQGALRTLANVYDSNGNVDINLDIAVDYIDTPAQAVLETEAEQQLLLAGYPASPTHDAMNIFVISSLDYLSDGVIGLSAGIPGPFTRQGTVVSGTLAEYQSDGEGTILGFILAHEFGHFLGLFHTSQTDGTGSAIIGADTIADTALCTTADLSPGGIDNCPDRDNLMFPFVDDVDDPPVSIGQGNVIKFNPGITVP